MNLAQLKLELHNRGFDNVNPLRQANYINWARAELDEAEMWPYRIATSTGAAPLTVADLGPVIQVTESTTNTVVLPAERNDLVEQFGAQSSWPTTGSQQFWYRDSSTIIAAYPATTTSISVRYFKIPADLTVATDSPLAPSRFHRTIVDIAAREAYRDRGDHDSAEKLEGQIERSLAAMRTSLLTAQVQGPTKGAEATEAW